MISEEEQPLLPYEHIMEVNRVEKNIYQCLADVETPSASSLGSHAVSVSCRDTRGLCVLEQFRDILAEVVSFLYPIEWGRLAQTSQVMADSMILIR